MTTKSLVTFIKRHASNFTRPEILDFMDTVHEFVLKKPVYQSMKLDGTNEGLPPFIVTKDKQHEYDCPADCWRTIRIFARRLQRSFAARNYVTRNRKYYFSKETFTEIDVRSFDATEDTVGKLIFHDNPGDSTEQFFHLYLKKPAVLLSENIQLDLAPQHHVLFRNGVLALIRSEEYGDQKAWLGWINDGQSGAKYIWFQMNKGIQARLFRTIIREEFQELGPYYNYA